MYLQFSISITLVLAALTLFADSKKAPWTIFWQLLVTPLQLLGQLQLSSLLGFLQVVVNFLQLLDNYN